MLGCHPSSMYRPNRFEALVFKASGDGIRVRRKTEWVLWLAMLMLPEGQVPKKVVEDILMQKLGCSPRTARKILSQLVENGYVEVEVRGLSVATVRLSERGRETVRQLFGDRLLQYR